MRYAFVLLGLAGCASAQQPPVAVANSPPPIVAIPVQPPYPSARPPMPPAPRIVRPPQPLRPAQAYFMPDDYPASARAQRTEGWVAFTLQVGPNGRVHGCTVIGSSGSAVLDATTCTIMRRRARFTPAIDSNGQPAPWVASGDVEWKLP